MATRSVPERHLGSLSKLLSLADEEMETFVSALKATSLTLDPAKALTKAVREVNSLSSGEVKEVSDAILSLYMTMASSGDTVASFAEDIVVAIEAADSDAIKLADENRDLFRGRLIAVLAAEPMATSMRAVSVQYEHLNIFSKSRVITDIKPVFGESADDSPKAAIIGHTLNVHYYQETHKEFFVSLDTEDLQELIDILQRAQSKAKKLEAIIQETGMPFIGKK